MRALILAAAVLAATPALANLGQASITGNAIGCVDPDVTEQAIELAQSGDEQAFLGLLAPHVARGTCAIVEGRVTLLDVSVWSGLAQVREQGDHRRLWVSRGQVVADNAALNP